MPSRSRPLLAVAVLAVVAVACGGGSSTLATVDGEDIGRDDLVALRTSYQDAATAAGSEVREDLTGLIVEEAMAVAARRDFGIELTEDEITERFENPPPRYQPIFDQIAADETVGEGMARSNARRSLIRDAVVEVLVLEAFGGAEGLLTRAPEDVTQVCARHILVQTEEEAQDVIRRLDEGEGFSDLVAEVSLDDGTEDGALAGPQGCPLHVNPLGPEFAAAAAATPVGEIGGPVTTEFGVHVITIDERLEPTIEELETDLSAYLYPEVGSSFFGSWFNEAVQAADVEVASVAGTWSPSVSAIVPPGGEEESADPAPPELQDS